MNYAQPFTQIIEELEKEGDNKKPTIESLAKENAELRRQIVRIAYTMRSHVNMTAPTVMDERKESPKQEK